VLNSNISPTCPYKVRPTSDWDHFVSLGHPRKFSTGFASWLRYCSDVAHRSQPKFTWCLHVSWAAILWWNFATCKNHFTSKTRSPILAALLHSTPAAGVSQTLRRGRPTRNGITELSQRAPPISLLGWVAITLGIGPHSSSFFLFLAYCQRSEIRCLP